MGPSPCSAAWLSSCPTATRALPHCCASNPTTPHPATHHWLGSLAMRDLRFAPAQAHFRRSLQLARQQGSNTYEVSAAAYLACCVGNPLGMGPTSSAAEAAQEVGGRVGAWVGSWGYSMGVRAKMRPWSMHSHCRAGACACEAAKHGQALL